MKKKFHSTDGYAVAEFAITIPILISVFALCMWAFGLALLKLQIDNYANNIARLIARGQTISSEQLTGAPIGMTFTVNELGSQIVVETKLITFMPFLKKPIELKSVAQSVSEIYSY